MPVYTYHCQACDKTFDVTQRMSDKALTDCECGEKGQVKRLLSAGAGVIFKGTGFYQTDYKGGNPSTPAASAEPKSEPKSDPAPASSGCGAAQCCMNPSNN